MPSNRVPRLRRHAPGSLGVVTLNGKDHYLGPWPAKARQAPLETKQRYDRLIGEWLANDRRSPTAAEQGPKLPTVNELILKFYRWAEGHYRRTERPPTNFATSGEPSAIRVVCTEPCPSMRSRP